MIVVDGYNAIRRVDWLKSAEAGGGLAAGRRALLAAIVSSGVLRNHRVLVFFDGSADVEGGELPPVSHPRLFVRFSRPPKDADAAIVSALRGRGVKEGVLLVTADRDLAFRARSLGARVQSPESWEGTVPRRLGRRRRRAMRGDSNAVSAGEEKPRATEAEVDYWLSVFGDDETG